MKRKKSAAIAKKNQVVLEKMREIKADHPLWGYRRVWAYLKFRMGLPVNRKRVYRLMSDNDLLVKGIRKLRAKRCGSRPKPVAERPNQFWGTDMTKIMIGPWGWIYLIIVLDWFTKEIVGYSISMTSKASDWLEALEMALNKKFPEGIRETSPDLQLISDNGCQPTSVKYMKSCSILGLKQIFTTWDNPKGNADTERVIRTIKEDMVWTRDWDDPFAFAEEFSRWVEKYNTDFPHQSLSYMTPEECFERYQNKEVVLTNS